MYETIFYSKKVNDFFTDEAVLGYMLRFEQALAVAQAKCHVIPEGAAIIIAACCKIESINKEQLIADAGLGGNINIPLVKQLTSFVRKKDAEAAKYVHFGATSQDVIDTAIMMQVRDAVSIINEDLAQLVEGLFLLAKTHRDTVMIGRSFMQHARPITFGFKVAGWLDALLRSKHELEELLKSGFALQLGGAVGTLSGMEAHGPGICKHMSELLQLINPLRPWHTQRDRFVSVAATLGILAGNVGKMAKDISLMSQTEISEVLESSAEGRGGSSTMPHKRNPVTSITVLANVTRIPGLVSTMFSCMIQDHERSTGQWHAEWETLSDIVKLTAGCLHKAVELIAGLEVNTDQMRQNLETTNGLIYAENITLALAKEIGKADAHELLEQCCRKAEIKKIHLKEVVSGNPGITKYLNDQSLTALFDPKRAIGSSTEFVDRILNFYSGNFNKSK